MSATKAAFALFCLSVICFVGLGPWRAVHGFYSYDFLPLFGATRGWMHGLNPYDMHVVAAQVNLGGYDAASFSKVSPIQPSVYMPTVFPLLAPIALLPWSPSRIVWACLSALAFASSLPLLFLGGEVSRARRWLVLTGAFCFSATSLGLSHGNPSVLACSLTMIAIYFAIRDCSAFSALALGFAHCLKPQISLAAVLLFALWGYWRPLLLSFVYPLAAALISVVRAPSLATFWRWMATLHTAVSNSSSAGGINDPTPANHWAYSMVNIQTVLTIWVRSVTLANILALVVTAALILLYLWFRRREAGDTRFRDMAFFAAVVLMPVYHRFYDEQLLLMVIPFLLTFSGKGKTRTFVLWLTMLLLLFPLHVISERLFTYVNVDSLFGVVLLRPLPLLVLTICLLVIPWDANPPGTAQEGFTPSALC